MVFQQFSLVGRQCASELSAGQRQCGTIIIVVVVAIILIDMLSADFGRFSCRFRPPEARRENIYRPGHVFFVKAVGSYPEGQLWNIATAQSEGDRNMLVTLLAIHFICAALFVSMATSDQ